MKVRMNLEELSIDEVFPNRWNPNQQSEFIFDKLVKSLDDEGEVLPILVREKDDGTYEIIDGEHRWKAAKRLGADKILVNNLGKMPDHKAQLLGQKINRTKGIDDAAKLKDLYGELLGELSKDDILSELPTSETEFDLILKDVPTDWMDMPGRDKKSSGPEGGDDEWVKLQLDIPSGIKEEFDRQMMRFKKLLYPNENPRNVSEVMPFEAMLQVIAQTPDEHVMGREL